MNLIFQIVLFLEKSLAMGTGKRKRETHTHLLEKLADQTTMYVSAYCYFQEVRVLRCMLTYASVC
jgi:hypothetical protein